MGEIREPDTGDGTSVLLLMEDGETSRTVVENLESAGYRVITADDACGAVSWLQAMPGTLTSIDCGPET